MVPVLIAVKQEYFRKTRCCLLAAAEEDNGASLLLSGGVLIGSIQRQAKTVASDLQHEKTAEAVSCNTPNQCCRPSGHNWENNPE